MNTIDNTLTKQDKELFQELDKNSSKLRTASEKFADFLMKLNQSTDIKPLIHSLDNISHSPIEKMDEAILSLNKSLSLVTAHMGDSSHKSLDKDSYSKFIELTQAVTNEATQLMNKAIELDQRQA